MWLHDVLGDSYSFVERMLTARPAITEPHWMISMALKLRLKTINELLGNSLYIPKYQRGYRWLNRPGSSRHSEAAIRQAALLRNLPRCHLDGECLVRVDIPHSSFMRAAAPISHDALGVILSPA